jgi:hypothetical protein
MIAGYFFGCVEDLRKLVDLLEEIINSSEIKIEI